MNLSIPKKYHALIGLIFISTAIRLFLAFFIELGNDEVYYHTYALYPDWSHFDHPPMVGWFLKIFSLGLFMHGTWLMRLPAILFAAINTWLMFELGSRIKNEKTGWYAALLYTTSIYTSIIAGLFIMPDTPQVFFWIVALYLMVDVLPDKDMVGPSKRRLLILGVVIGLGMLSKYTSVFLWLGVFLYLILYNRNWFKTWQLYVSGLLSLITFLPVLIWNYLHHFISFTFHGGRVDVQNSTIRFDLLGTEILGQFFYQNPVVFILVWLAVFYGIRHHYNFVEKRKFHLLLFQAVPIIVVFLFFSLFRRTLPHWTGPAYISLIIIGATFLSRKTRKRIFNYPPFIRASLITVFIVLSLGVGEIKYGAINLKKIIGKDITLDLYGWRQMKKQFSEIKQRAEQEQIIQKNAALLSHKWFPAAHLDYYVAQRNNTHVLAWGSLDQIHKYAWINIDRGGFKKGMDFWYITLENNYRTPDIYKSKFEQIIAYDTMKIVRSGKVINHAYVYIFENLKELPKDELTEFLNEQKQDKTQ
jgi:4-amino-4-deoxy-L-arabinose transferase-like glycosyltransferase